MLCGDTPSEIAAANEETVRLEQQTAEDAEAEALASLETAKYFQMLEEESEREVTWMQERVEEDWQAFEEQQRAETERLAAAEEEAFKLGVAAAEAAAADEAAAREEEEAAVRAALARQFASLPDSHQLGVPTSVHGPAPSTPAGSGQQGATSPISPAAQAFIELEGMWTREQASAEAELTHLLSPVVPLLARARPGQLSAAVDQSFDRTGASQLRLTSPLRGSAGHGRGTGPDSEHGADGREALRVSGRAAPKIILGDDVDVAFTTRPRREHQPDGHLRPDCPAGVSSGTGAGIEELQWC